MCALRCEWCLWGLVLMGVLAGCDASVHGTGEEPSSVISVANRSIDEGLDVDAFAGGHEVPPAPCTVIGDWDYGLIDTLSNTQFEQSLTLTEEFPDDEGNYVCGQGGGSSWCESPCRLAGDPEGVPLTGMLGTTLIWGGLFDGEELCFTTGGSYGMQIYRAQFDSESCELRGSVSTHGGSWNWDAWPAQPGEG